MKCQDCEIVFVEIRPNQKFCSKLCRRRATQARNIEKIRRYQRDYHKKYYREKIAKKKGKI